MVKTVVVVGSSFAGLAVSHRLLKYTRQKQPDLRVVLVSKVSFPSAGNHLIVRPRGGAALSVDACLSIRPSGRPAQLYTDTGLS